MSANPRFIQIYSGNRNRMIYPIQSSFIVPFSSSLQNVKSKDYLDQEVKGSVYFSYCLSAFLTPVAKGIFQSVVPLDLTPSYNYAYLYAKQNVTGIFYPSIPGYLDLNQYSLITDYYRGYYIVNDTTGEENIISSYNPSNGYITFNKPFIQPITPGDSYSIYAGYPSDTSVFIPDIDINYNKSLNYEGSYNGYYIVFETPNPNYSNSDNSNIFYRKISYYDNANRLAYFDDPLPFSYQVADGIQEFTIRKSLPIERWTISTQTYNNTKVSNNLIGPLIGLVITLPNTASNIDNYYKGKYVYFSSNQADSYDPPFPNPDFLQNPLPNTFYPIYGLYYINAYNGTTKELSVCRDLSDTSCEIVRHVIDPPTYQILGYNSSSFDGKDGLLTPVFVGGTEYESYPNPIECCPYPGVLSLLNNITPTYQTGRRYKFKWNIKFKDMTSAFFEVIGASQSYISPTLTDSYQLLEFTLIPVQTTLYFRFYMDFAGGLSEAIIWDFFQVETEDIINISSFDKEIAQPLAYNGSIVSQNQTVCYEISLLNITLPNVPLISGSRIAFYPYVYIELSNVTSPSKASTSIIYSNNPNSKRALFIAPISQVSNPNLGTFITLWTSMTQTIKFKPNDNLQFRVFLPNGKLFQTLLPDILSPYGPDPRLQINAVFSVLRVGMDSNDKNISKI